MRVSSTNGSGKPRDYPGLLADIKQRIRAQYAALKAANQQLVGLYWEYRSDDREAAGG